MKFDQSNLVKFCVGGMSLSQLVKHDRTAKEAAMDLHHSPTLPEVGEYTVEGCLRGKPTYSLTIESDTPWKGGTFKAFCEHWDVVEFHTAK